MGGLFGGGGGGGSPPKAPKLRQVDTSLTGPLYTESAQMGDTWANLMRGAYGFQPPTAAAPGSWESQIPGAPKGVGLGQGALAMMGQAALPFAGKQDPQMQAVLQKGFGAGGGGGRVFGGAGAGSSWDLGSNPYQTSAELGQQFSAPYQQATRNQSFLNTMLNQWKPPDLRLTGEDLLNVKMGQAAQNAQAQQAAYQAALLGSSSAAQQQSMAQNALIGSVGQLGAAGIRAAFSPSLSSQGYYQPSPFAGLFGGGAPYDTMGGQFATATIDGSPVATSSGGS